MPCSVERIGIVLFLNMAHRPTVFIFNCRSICSWIFLTCLYTPRCQCSKDVYQRLDVLNSLINGNNTWTSPYMETGKPLYVKIQMRIHTFSDIDQVKMEYRMMLQIRMTWVDTRLKYKTQQSDLFTPLELTPPLIKKIWRPDLYFINTKKAVSHDVTQENKRLLYYPNGTLSYSQRVTMIVYCEMNLWKFPFDSQLCYVTMGSYRHSIRELQFMWDKEGVKTDSLMQTLRQYRLLKLNAVNCSRLVGLINNGTCLRANFFFIREVGYYMIQVYMPSGLVVLLSWVSFWLDPEATPARVTLGLISVLTMTTQRHEMQVLLPRLSYIKAIDVWMGTCLMFVFAALLEFAYVNIQTRGLDFIDELRDVIYQDRQLADRMSAQPNTTILSPDDQMAVNMEDSKWASARQADKFAQLAFPTVFLFFNVVYWYLFVVHHIDEHPFDNDSVDKYN